MDVIETTAAADADYIEVKRHRRAYLLGLRQFINDYGQSVHKLHRTLEFVLQCAHR